MAQQVMSLACKSVDLKSLHRPHRGGKRQLTPKSCPLTFIYGLQHTHIYIGDHSHIHTVIIVRLNLPSVVVHSFNPRTQETEAGEFL